MSAPILRDSQRKRRLLELGTGVLTATQQADLQADLDALDRALAARYFGMAEFCINHSFHYLATRSKP